MGCMPRGFSTCPAVLTLCHTNYILGGTEISGTIEQHFCNVHFLSHVILVQPESIRETIYLLLMHWVIV